MKNILIVLLLINLLFSASIVGKKAPSFNIDTWLQSNNKSLDIDDYKGKVLFILTFQDGCSYCHDIGLPQLEDLQRMYEDYNDIKFLIVETAFESNAANDIDDAKFIIKQYHLNMPMGISKRNEYGRPVFMDTYQTGGTPWVTIIDKKGIIKYSNFQISLMNVVYMLEALEKE